MNNNRKTDEKRRALLVSSALFKTNFRKCMFLTVLIFLFLLMGLHFVSSPYTSLAIIDTKSEKILWKSEITPEEFFYHQYIHSVEKSPVIEKFKMDKSGVILTMESWTKSFGAGLPHAQEGTVEMKDGFYILKDLNRPIHGGVLLMQPSTMFPHTFHFREDEILLSEAPFAGTRIKFEIQAMSWLEVFYNKFVD